jgi:hypothetical protein
MPSPDDLGIAFQPALALQVTPNPVRYLMHQLCQFATGGFIDPMEPTACTLGAIDVDITHPLTACENEYSKINALPKSWINVTAPVSAVFLVKPAL